MHIFKRRFSILTSFGAFNSHLSVIPANEQRKWRNVRGQYEGNVKATCFTAPCLLSQARRTWGESGWNLPRFRYHGRLRAPSRQHKEGGFGSTPQTDDQLQWGKSSRRRAKVAPWVARQTCLQSPAKPQNEAPGKKLNFPFVYTFQTDSFDPSKQQRWIWHEMMSPFLSYTSRNI